ncbi:PAS domain-containing protein [Bradyrhizobium sp. 6(2017)]|uniref:PAS domain-containing protein n=1 Tax=Bradyrhizobium sp. 6(2017) TaxID=1197460 RepID=UPI0013E16C18|nr:PAS domain-containing protein [Bradyrhizobium sp. 6(2017)]QIG93444.1 PAS domain-containing protein [Bradyrhizobium sp. 6(2017)]
MLTSTLPSRLKWPVIMDYGIACVTPALIVVLEVLFSRLWGIDPPASVFFLCGIMIVAWISGPGPALFATALTVLAFDYFLIQPIYSFAFESKEFPRLVLLTIASLFVVSLSAVQGRATASLRRMRDEQQQTVRELRKLNESLHVENTERRRAEENVRRTEQELRLIVDNIPVLAARYRPDGMMDFRNKTWRDYTGLSRDNLEGHRWGSALHPDDLAMVEREWRSHIATGGPFELEQRLRRADGEYRWHRVRRVPLHDDSGNVIKWYAVAFDIEDRRLAEEAQRRSEAALSEARRELQLTIDSIPVMVSTFDPDGTRSFVNQPWQNYTGHTQREATGKGLNTSIYYHPDDVERFDNAWRVAQAKGETLSVDVRTRRADGAYRWYNMRRAPLRDERGNIVKWYSVGIDVDDQKVAENALQRSEANLAEAQKLSLTGSFSWDLANDDIFWSDETYQIMGFDRSVKPSLDLIMQRVHPDDRARETDRAVLGAQNHDDFELRLLMPDGQIKHLHVRAHRVKYASGKEEIVGALMDITESRKSQAALDAAQTALAHACRVATLGEISASIAHEVNQPLAAIVANGQACLRFLRRETPDLNKLRGAIEWIVKDGKRADEVIRRVRGLLKKADSQRALLNVNDIICEVTALLQRELSAQHATLRLELASAVPLIVGDRVQLQQVIINLVVNGVDAMQAVTDRSHELLIRSYEDEAHQIVVAVRDSGVGIPAETANRLFDTFFSTKPSGLGIGLSICRSIVEDHGGRLWATNNTGEPGATFQFALPSPQGQAP